MEAAGKALPLTTVRSPEEDRGVHRWVFLFLPVNDPAILSEYLRSALLFLERVPQEDKALILLWQGSACKAMTPGFTADPALWAQGLRNVKATLHPAFDGDVDPGVHLVLPALDAADADRYAWERPALKAAEADFPATKIPESVWRAFKNGSDVAGIVNHELLQQNVRAMPAHCRSLANLVTLLAEGRSDLQMVVFSRNAFDDVADLPWLRMVMGQGNDMLRLLEDIRVEQDGLKEALGRGRLTLHTVAAGINSHAPGAFAEGAEASGGWRFALGPALAEDLSRGLPLWERRYRLAFLPPVPGDGIPRAVRVSTSRPGLKVLAPTLWAGSPVRTGHKVAALRVEAGKGVLDLGPDPGIAWTSGGFFSPDRAALFVRARWTGPGGKACAFEAMAQTVSKPAHGKPVLLSLAGATVPPEASGAEVQVWQPATGLRWEGRFSRSGTASWQGQD